MSKKGDLVIGIAISLNGALADTPVDDLWRQVKVAAAAEWTFPHIIKMPCGRTVQFDDAEHFIGIDNVDIKCLCGGNHYIVRFVDRRKPSKKPARESPVGKVVRVEEREGGIDVVAELSVEGATRLKGIGIIEEIKDDRPRSKVNNDNSDSGVERTDTPAGSPDTGKPKQSPKPKAKRKARKRAKKVLPKD